MAEWATRAEASAGRRRPEPPCTLRTAFQRDRDRILHTKAFRRLSHKTQVFLAPEGDHYRTRLTHTLEVAQVARTIARGIRLNEDLVEAICLGHDLGHPPFGHVGEEILSEVTGRAFEHNRQSLRIVDELERDGAGLNLTAEVRDGILNHTWRMPEPTTPEGLVTRWADRIAYVSHDMDDAIRAGALTERNVPADVRRVLGGSYGERLDLMVRSLIDASVGAGRVEMPAEVAEAMLTLRTFLFDRVYLDVARDAAGDAEVVIRGLVDHYRAHPEALPPGDGETLQRLVDYVSGMTDRFAYRTHRAIDHAR